MKRTRIWCETVTIEALTSRAVTGLLSRHGVDPILAVQPEQQAALPEALRRLRGEGLCPAVWPMLSDWQGRWGSAWNAEPFAAWVRQVATTAGAMGDRPLEVVVDLEPPIQLLAAGFSPVWRSVRHPAAGPHAVHRRAMSHAFTAFAALAQTLRSDGFHTMAAVAPMVVFDSLPSAAGRGWQTLLGTPVDGVGWDTVNVMAYSSIVRGWSRGALPRRVALALIGQAAAHASRRFGQAASVSLGAVGVGALGDEPVMGDVNELREDVAAVRAAGVEDIALFELGGVLARREPDAWLDALLTKSCPAPHSTRAAAVAMACTSVSRAVEAVSALRGLRRCGDAPACGTDPEGRDP